MIQFILSYLSFSSSNNFSANVPTFRALFQHLNSKQYRRTSRFSTLYLLKAVAVASNFVQVTAVLGNGQYAHTHLNINLNVLNLEVWRYFVTPQKLHNKVNIF